MKRLTVESYLDGYNTRYLQCVDLVYATLAGYYGREYYQNYCFIRACMRNFQGFNREFTTEQERREYILSFLGLKVKCYSANTKKEFFDIIETKIQEGIPLYMPIKNQAVFFKKSNNGNTWASGSFIICGYDKEQQLSVIQDISITRWNLKHHFRGEVFCRLQLTNEMLEEIRKESAKLFSQQEKMLSYEVCTIEKVEEHAKEFQPINFFIERMHGDKLQIEIQGFNKFLQEERVIKYPEARAEYFLFVYHRTLTIIQETLEKCRQNLNLDNCIDVRQGIILNIARRIMKLQEFTEEEKDECIRRLQENNKSLYEELCLK